MRSPTRLRFAVAVWVLFTLFAGEAIRNTLSWYGFAVWGVLVAVVLAVVGVRMWRGRGDAQGGDQPRGRVISRRPLRGLLNHREGRPLDRRGGRLPLLLLGAFLGWAVVSLVWSAYPLATVLAIVVLGATTGAAAVLYAWIGWSALLRALAVALQAILALSLLFEAVVAGILRRPILPVFPIDVDPGEKVPQAFYWSRALLFEGGRIQGILGNANLLGFVALLALIVTGCLLAARRVRPGLGWAGVALAALMLVLTRSSTVLVATAACAVTLGLMLLWRSSPARRIPFWLAVAALAVLGALVLAAQRTLLPLLGKSEDLTGRFDIWSAVLGLVGERPVLGWGWMSYWVPGVEPYEGLAVRNGVEYLQAHNAFLDVTVQLGVLGLLLFLALLGALIARIGRRGVPAVGSSWLLGRVLPALLLTALLTQALAESRLLVEGNWALLVLLTLAVSGIPASRAAGAAAEPTAAAPPIGEANRRGPR
ncbi:O-antigen ligase [Naasia sp. SYSU D00057]|uniref:O-antigen ligase family protein n=1 Tax=Naasia sp. SYSU D00057 TaxID=2817380 RepID=UPI001B3147B4|nr:O-antigen ligase family protein [Naasia sp. SYSU D00057]